MCAGLPIISATAGIHFRLMKYLDLTLPSPEQNLALEEALLEWAETTQNECLRFWESATHFVVLGAGSPINTDVNRAQCERLGVPVLRRCSGGGTVVQGPGCLNYTLVLDMEKHAPLSGITSTNDYILGRVASALERCGLPGATVQGISDLTQGPLKFSGNAQRRRKRFILFHGTLLHRFDLALISQCLDVPEKMPDYRGEREHGLFVTNIAVDAARAKREIAAEWGAESPLVVWPIERTTELARTRYCDPAWTERI